MTINLGPDSLAQASVVWAGKDTAELRFSPAWQTHFDINTAGPVALYNHGGKCGFSWRSTAKYENRGYEHYCGGNRMLIEWGTLRAMGDEKLAFLVTGVVFGYCSSLTMIDGF